MFVRGSTYTRRQISDQLGGELQTYMPAKNGRVVALCLTDGLNLPNVVLVGLGPKIRERAECLVRQSGVVPLFKKIRSNVWRYEGEWIVKTDTTDQTTIDDLRRKAGRKESACRALFIEPAST